MIKKAAGKTDKVRPSRDGHEYHETWLARKSLQLLLPDNNLIGIAIEGLSPFDQKKAKSETVEVADATLYYGSKPTFAGAKKVIITQFKYSVSKKEVEFRASDAKKTMTKFAIAFKDYKSQHKSDEVLKKLRFELITNRPIYSSLQNAIKGLTQSFVLKGNDKRQAEQLKRAVNLKGRELQEFAQRCSIIGFSGDLDTIKEDISRTLVDWSASDDAIAKIRLGGIKQLVRDKAGSKGANNNIIRRVDIYSKLEVSDDSDLLPCPTSLSKIGKVISREQQGEVLDLVDKSNNPILITANGGVGKTVFLESLRQELSKDNEVVFFDCFGGGAYRAKDDSRHLPKRGLIHIVNTLAFKGYCDPILPSDGRPEDLLRTFRRRIKQCVSTLRLVNSSRNLILILDAIDNAAYFASDNNESSFPTLIFESLDFNSGIEGFKVIASCRPYRKELSVNNASNFSEFPLSPFSYQETKIFLEANLQKVTEVEIQVAYARSGGNPRILDHLINSDRGLLDASQMSNEIKLDELIEERIDTALTDAYQRGYTKSEINSFLAGLTVLPPPVPIQEYAKVFELDPDLIESFASDLAPLLERTKFGLIFRDEPTETFIRDKYGENLKALNKVADSLLNTQRKSAYATTCLPGLLQKIGDQEKLFHLAFDDSFPNSITSTTGKRNIRLIRLKAAIEHTLKVEDFESLVPLLVEMSTLSDINKRGTHYILNAPDLVVSINDADAMRRLFETKTSWPGAKHARLSIANMLSSDIEEANRHNQIASEWVSKYLDEERKARDEDDRFDRNKPSPEKIDIAAIAFCKIAQGKIDEAISYVRVWRDWYSFEFFEYVFAFILQYESLDKDKEAHLIKFLNALSNEAGVIISALTFLELDDKLARNLIKKLSTVTLKLENDNTFTEKELTIQDGILKASAQALSLGCKQESLEILSFLKVKRPKTSIFFSHFSAEYILPFLLFAAIKAGSENRSVRKVDLLSSDLLSLIDIRKITEANFYNSVNNKIEKRYRDKLNSEGDEARYARKHKEEAKKFLGQVHEIIYIFSESVRKILVSESTTVNSVFDDFVKQWKELTENSDNYSYRNKKRFLEELGTELGTNILWVCKDLNYKAAKKFIDFVYLKEFKKVSQLISLISIFSKRTHLHELAGEVAIKAKSFIESDNNTEQRGPLFINLSRAVLTASQDDAVKLFKIGLDQMDAIGSDDYWFISELLYFASKIKDGELDEEDAHVLTNLCELNLEYDTKKFPWATFADGMSCVMGNKVLAKLTRWDSRDKITLGYTLLPILVSLVGINKLEPELAVILNRLSNPVELHTCGSEDFISLLEKKASLKNEALLEEAIRQYLFNLSGLPYGETLEVLAGIADRVNIDSGLSQYLASATRHFEEVRR